MRQPGQSEAGEDCLLERLGTSQHNDDARPYSRCSEHRIQPPLRCRRGFSTYEWLVRELLWADRVAGGQQVLPRGDENQLILTDRFDLHVGGLSGLNRRFYDSELDVLGTHPGENI